MGYFVCAQYDVKNNAGYFAYAQYDGMGGWTKSIKVKRKKNFKAEVIFLDFKVALKYNKHITVITEYKGERDGTEEKKNRRIFGTFCRNN